MSKLGSIFEANRALIESLASTHQLHWQFDRKHEEAGAFQVIFWDSLFSFTLSVEYWTQYYTSMWTVSDAISEQARSLLRGEASELSPIVALYCERYPRVREGSELTVHSAQDLERLIKGDVAQITEFLDGLRDELNLP